MRPSLKYATIQLWEDARRLTQDWTLLMMVARKLVQLHYIYNLPEASYAAEVSQNPAAI